MAIVTLKFTDIDLDSGEFKADLINETATDDDGFVTAAQLTALYVQTQLSNPAFVKAVWDFAESLIANNSDASFVNNDNRPYPDQTAAQGG